MTSVETFAQADRAFVDEDYDTAISLYSKARSAQDEGQPCLLLRHYDNRCTQALQEAPGSAKIYESKSHAHLKNEDYMPALADAAKAVELDPSNAKGYLRQG